ncbi:hypothetical protein [Humidisolicoccus flavus]|uniref:hypothetical protein n=1 Tax=Humidisolicoccus flavus TaxID=3111414 RepID=UPI003243B190
MPQNSDPLHSSFSRDETHSSPQHDFTRPFLRVPPETIKKAWKAEADARAAGDESHDDNGHGTHGENGANGRGGKPNPPTKLLSTSRQRPRRSGHR